MSDPRTTGRQHDVEGQSRAKSFRLSFLVAYAGRIGERFAAASSSVTDELQRDDQRLLPIRAARNSAADLAMLDVRDSIAG